MYRLLSMKEVMINECNALIIGIREWNGKGIWSLTGRTRIIIVFPKLRNPSVSCMNYAVRSITCCSLSSRLWSKRSFDPS